MKKRFYVLNTGPTMSQELADLLRGENVIAVNNTYELAPWAFALCATDRSWWDKNPSALEFAGMRYTTSLKPPVGVNQIRIGSVVNDRTCSGVVAMQVAKMHGATEIVLLGTDFHGTHYFGDYQNGLYNTSDHRRRIHAKQFFVWYLVNRSRINILNASPGTQLRHIPTCKLEDIL